MSYILHGAMMRNRLFTAFICPLALFVSLSMPSNAYQISKLANGLTVIVDEDHSVNLVAVDIWVKAGSGAETEKQNGISHFIEHMVYGATNKRKAGDMDMEMESVGATLDAHTSRDWAHFNTTVAAKYLPKALDVFSDAIRNAKFNQEDLDREKLVIEDEIARKCTKPNMLCSDYLAQELYGNFPYARPIEGTVESISKLTREDIVNYYKANYVPENIAVVIVGDVNPQEAFNVAETAFGGMSNSSAANLESALPSAPSKEIIKTIPSNFKNDYIAIGFLGPRSADVSDFCAADVLVGYLGVGYRSWMSTTLKDKMGISDEVSAEFLTQRYPGMISLIAATKPDKAESVKQTIFEKIEKIRKDGLSEGELAAAKRSLVGDYAFNCETFAGRATSIGFYYAIADADFDAKYVKCINAVSNEDVIRVANKYLDPDHSVLIILKAGGAK